MRIVETIAAFRAARRGVGELGFVPTMGALHEGHLSLVRRAKVDCGFVAVSIFVNPTQFAAGEDFERYPRDPAADAALLEQAGADLLFAPTVEEIYPPGFDTVVRVGGVTEGLEGAARPGHFEGVATVVAKLFNIVQPTRAYFGQKDAQQAAVIHKLVRDLAMPLSIMVAPTVREADGLAMSSRNRYLAPDERAAATCVYRALTAAQAAFQTGERDAGVLRNLMAGVIAAEPLASVDYASVANPVTLTELTEVGPAALLSLAVRIGRTRLIDNLPVARGGA